MRNAVVITTDEEVEIIDLDAQAGSLKVLQDAVGGWVQAIDLSEDLTMWCNEEGKLVGMPYNPLATLEFQERFGQTDIIVGNAVFTGGVDDEGETLGLTDSQVNNFLKMYS